MDLALPASALLPPLRARVVTVLAGTEQGLTGRRIAVLAEGSVAGVAKVLDGLVSAGLVHRVEAGSANLYYLNRHHLAAPAAVILAGMRHELVARFAASFDAFTHPPASAVLFGSAARGDGDADSDIDLLLVRPRDVAEDETRWVADVERLGRHVLAWTGNVLNVVEYGLAELGSRSVFLAEAGSEGLLLYGADLRTLRRRAVPG